MITGRQRDSLKPFMRLSLILVLTMAAATLTASASPSLTVGDAQLLYSDAQMPFTMDGPFATLKRDANTMYFWHTDAETTTKWIGTLTNPLQTLAWSKSIEQGQVWRTTAAGSPNGIAGAWPGPGDLWLYGVYKIDSTHLLGFVHREKNGGGSGPPSSMGLAYSSDTGDSWTYLGD